MRSLLALALALVMIISSAKAADTPKDKPLTIVADLPIPKAAAFTDWEGCARNGTCTKPELLLTNDVFCAVQGSCTPCVGLDLKAATACEKTGFRHPIHCNVTTDASAQLPTEESCTIVSDYAKYAVWHFEAITFGILIVSNVVLWRRKRHLARVVYERLARRAG